MAGEPLTAPALVPQPTPVEADWSVRRLVFEFPDGPDGYGSLITVLGVRGPDGRFYPGLEKTVHFHDNPNAPEELEKLIGKECCAVAMAAIIPGDNAAAVKHGVGGLTFRDAGVKLIKDKWARDAAREQARKEAEAARLQAEADRLEAEAAALREQSQ